MKSIIIATDFSESALNAAKYAAALAKPFGVDQIILYHSYDTPPAATEIPVTELDTGFAQEKSREELEVVERELRLMLGDTSVQIERVADELPLVSGVERLAERWQAVVIAAGATGKSGLERFLVGSSTVHLASEVKVPLLIVPKDARYRPFNKIVFACDLKKVSRTTPTGQISFWLERLQAKLLVLNVALAGKRFDPYIIPEQYKIHHLLDNFNPEYHYVESEDIADEIEDFAEGQGAGLIITIPKSYGFFEGLFHPSISRKLIRESDVPLLLLREREQ